MHQKCVDDDGKRRVPESLPQQSTMTEQPPTLQRRQ